ncbi:hypothetical protein C8A00DRAFT_39484 [Chaetomidium leptoderma]|uniref:Uncharacterized protein n=1 Tax=Chaetomidium leptoderma TaxID=669021 RepID=A0AAN6VXC8_9PEZI|nr:hypothetical protein C8A00DRAFT_39484 [Chaetomidium leptoderma]
MATTTATTPEEFLLPASQATDILSHPTKSTLPRYAAYRRARHRFWEAFPGGVYTRLPTPGTNLECGLHAIILSMQQQQQHESRGVRVPTLEELREVFAIDHHHHHHQTKKMMGDGGWFTADQLASGFCEWGRRVWGDRVRCQLGWVTDTSTTTEHHPEGEGEDGGEGWPVMMNTPVLETGEETGEGIVRVWVWNDGASLRGGGGHFEGVRRPTEREVGVLRGGKETGRNEWSE